MSSLPYLAVIVALSVISGCDTPDTSDARNKQHSGQGGHNPEGAGSPERELDASPTFEHTLTINENQIASFDFSKYGSVELVEGNIDGVEVNNEAKKISWFAGELTGGTSLELKLESDRGESIKLIINVLETNEAPQLSTKQFAQKLTFDQRFSFNILAADQDFPKNKLTYQLIDAPQGVTVNEEGLIEGKLVDQGVSAFKFGFKVMDDGKPSLEAKGEVHLIAGKNAPVLIETLKPSEIVPTGHHKIAMIIADSDKDDQLSLVNQDETNNYQMIAGPKPLAELDSSLFKNDLMAHQVAVVVEREFTQGDNNINFSVKDSFGFEVRFEQVIEADALPVISEKTASFHYESFPQKVDTAFKVTDNQTPEVKIVSLNGHPITLEAAKWVHVESTDIDNQYRVNANLYANDFDCTMMSYFNENNNLEIEIKSGPHTIKESLNFTMPVVAGVSADYTTSIHFVSPEQGEYVLSHPYGAQYHLACQRELKVLGYSPNLGTVTNQNDGFLWTPGESIRGVNKLSIDLQITNHVTGEVTQATVHYPFNFNPIRNSEEQPTFNTNQNSTFRWELPFTELDGEQDQLDGSYHIGVYLKELQNVRSDFFGAFSDERHRPKLTIESNKFILDWDIECPAFLPGEYDLYVRIRQFEHEVNKHNAYYLQPHNDLSEVGLLPAEYSNVVKAKLVIAKAQPCSGHSFEYGYDVKINPPAGSSLKVSYDDGTNFLEQDFIEDRNLWVFDQNLILTEGRELNWVLTDGDQVIKSFQTKHYKDNILTGKISVDQVDYAVVKVDFNVSQFDTWRSFSLTNTYGDLCNRITGWGTTYYIWPCYLRVYKTGNQTLNIRKPGALYSNGNLVDGCLSKQINIESLEKQEISIYPLPSYSLCN